MCVVVKFRLRRIQEMVHQSGLIHLEDTKDPPRYPARHNHRRNCPTRLLERVGSIHSSTFFFLDVCSILSLAVESRCGTAWKELRPGLSRLGGIMLKCCIALKSYFRER